MLQFELLNAKWLRMDCKAMRISCQLKERPSVGKNTAFDERCSVCRHKQLYADGAQAVQR